MPPVVVAAEAEKRLTAAQDACEDAWDAYQARLEQRDKLIVEYVDAGVSKTAVARWARCASSNVTRVLANSHEE